MNNGYKATAARYKRRTYVSTTRERLPYDGFVFTNLYGIM